MHRSFDFRKLQGEVDEWSLRVCRECHRARENNRRNHQ
jgi:hypothetical protein